MSTGDDELMTRNLEILHRALVHIRNLAIEAGQEKIADLADTLEIMPLVMMGVAGDQELINQSISAFRAKYPDDAQKILHLHLTELLAATH